MQGLVEVQGNVNENNEVVCQSYLLLPGENADDFGTCVLMCIYSLCALVRMSPIRQTRL